MSRRAVTVVGIGDDGCVTLSARAMGAVRAAQVLAGGERHLAFFPEFEGERVPLKTGLSAALDRIAALAEENNVCILASGDPLFFGVGSLVVKRIGAEHVDILPQPSAMQWAFARVGMKWDDATFVSLHGRPMEGLLTRLGAHRKAAVFTDAVNSPGAIARHMLDHGQSAWRAWVCENLGGAGERVRGFTLEDLAQAADVGDLNVLLLERTGEWRAAPLVPYLHEDAFARRMPKKGLITKREIRVLSLAAMQLRRDSVVWDIGAGSGSISIEAGMMACEGRVFAIEVDAEGVEICHENIRTHGVDNVRVVHGRAPEALDGLDAPDAVFIGGSKGSLGDIIRICLDRMKPGGRLVVNAITLENVSEAYSTFRALKLDPEITLLQVSRGEPLAHYRRYEALNPIHNFAVTKEASA